jgi:hypothetical protein
MIINEVINRSGATLIGSLTYGDGWQGTNYYIWKKDNKYSYSTYSYGTCAMCDWQTSLEDEYHMETGEYLNPVPIAVYEPIVLHHMEQLSHWTTKENLIKQSHMIFGVAECEEENKFKEILENN